MGTEGVLKLLGCSTRSRDVVLMQVYSTKDASDNSRG
jgi:hypothetical protein